MSNRTTKEVFRSEQLCFKIVNNRWKMEISITMDILQTKILCHVKSHDQEPNYNFLRRFILKITKKLKISKAFS